MTADKNVVAIGAGHRVLIVQTEDHPGLTGRTTRAVRVRFHGQVGVVATRADQDIGADRQVSVANSHPELEVFEVLGFEIQTARIDRAIYRPRHQRRELRQQRRILRLRHRKGDYQRIGAGIAFIDDLARIGRGRIDRVVAATRIDLLDVRQRRFREVQRVVAGGRLDQRIAAGVTHELVDAVVVVGQTNRGAGSFGLCNRIAAAVVQRVEAIVHSRIEERRIRIACVQRVVPGPAAIVSGAQVRSGDRVVATTRIDLLDVRQRRCGEAQRVVAGVRLDQRIAAGMALELVDAVVVNGETNRGAGNFGLCNRIAAAVVQRVEAVVHSRIEERCVRVACVQRVVAVAAAIVSGAQVRRGDRVVAATRIDLLDVRQRRCGEVQRVVTGVRLDQRIATGVTHEPIDAVVVDGQTDRGTGNLGLRNRIAAAVVQRVIAIVRSRIEERRVRIARVQRVVASPAAIVSGTQVRRGDRVVAAARIDLLDVRQRRCGEVQRVVAGVRLDQRIAAGMALELVDAVVVNGETNRGAGNFGLCNRIAAAVVQRVEAVVHSRIEERCVRVACVQRVVAVAAAIVSGAQVRRGDRVVAATRIDLLDVRQRCCGEVQRVVAGGRLDQGIPAGMALELVNTVVVVGQADRGAGSLGFRDRVAGAVVQRVEAIVHARIEERRVRIARVQRVVASPAAIARTGALIGGGNRIVAVAGIDIEIRKNNVREIQRVVTAGRNDLIAARGRVAAVDFLDAVEVRHGAVDAQHVVGPAADDLIVPGAAVVLIDAVVVAGAAGDEIERVVQIAAGQGIVTRTAYDVILAAFVPLDGVVAVTALDREVDELDVLTGRAEIERVVTAGRDDSVVRRVAAAVDLLDIVEIAEIVGDAQHVIGPAALDDVVAVAAVILIETVVVAVAAGLQQEGVVTRAAIEDVVGGGAAQGVIAGRARNRSHGKSFPLKNICTVITNQ